MLRNLPARSRSLLAALFGRTSRPERRRATRPHRRRPIGAEQFESRAMLAGMVIDGGLSWNGWTYRGLSNEGGLYGSGGATSRDTYEVYTVAFAFAGNAISGDPVKAVAPAPDDFVTGREAWIPGGRQIQVSAGAFQAGNTILGIGIRATDSAASIAGFSPTIRFDLDNDSYKAASFEKDSLGRTTTLKNDGRTSFSTYAEPGDFTVQFEGSASWCGSSINVREAATPQLPAATVQLPGGVGSGTSYDFAFRAFAQPAAKSYQMFLDMTAIPQLYGSVYGTFFPGRAGVGTIGDRVTVSLNGLGTNNVVFGADLTLPSVDLDVDSDNADTIPDPGNDPVDRSSAEEAIEDDPALPGVIVPVGGDPAKMIVDVPQGRTATLAFDAGAASRVKVFSSVGTVVLEQGRLSTPIVGGTPQTFWIEAFAPSVKAADIAVTLTTTGSSQWSSNTIRATAVAVDLVAHRTGGKLGEIVSDDLESTGDPNSYMILTNRDFEQGLPFAGRDFDDEIAMLPPFVGTEGRVDDDLAKITLKRLPSGLNAGSVRLSVSHPDAVRLFKAAPGSIYGTALSPGEWTASLGGSGYLADLKSRDVDIWLEGLEKVQDFNFTIEYIAPSGLTCSDDVHMLIADWTFRGSDGYEVPFVSPVWLDALLAATDSPKKPLADPTGAFYKIHIDGLAPRLVTQLIVASDSTPDFYTESYAGGDFDTAYSTATVSRRFGVLHSAANVLYAPEDPVVTPAQRARIRDTLDLNVVHNDGLEAKVQTAFDKHVARIRAAPLFAVAVEKDVVPVNGRIRGTVTWTKRFPDDRPLFIHTNDGQESAPFDLTSAPGTMAFDFEAKESEKVTIGVGWKSGFAPGGFATFSGSILVRITANGQLPKWEAQAWDALKVDRFVPGDPINRNRQINTRYAQMYNSGISQDRPNPYGWFGVAAFVSTGVGVGMSTTMSWDAAPDSVGVDSRKVVDGLADGNLTIFIDVYKQALAYRDVGLKELEDMLKAGELRDKRQLEAWEAIHLGVFGDPAKNILPSQDDVDKGVRMLVQVEQDTTLQRVLNKDLPLWQTVTDNWGTALQANVTSPHWKSFLMTAPIPGDYSTFQQFRYEDPGVPDKVSFADVNARLAWFDKKLFPAWKVWRAANPGTIIIPKLLAGDYQK